MATSAHEYGNSQGRVRPFEQGFCHPALVGGIYDQDTNEGVLHRVSADRRNVGFSLLFDAVSPFEWPGHDSSVRTLVSLCGSSLLGIEADWNTEKGESMNSRRLRWSKALALCSLAASLTAFACAAARGQSQAATSLVGTVSDESGAVVPHATVAVTNVATGQSVTTLTDSSGRYRFSSLSPGTYKVSAALRGFKTMQRTGIALGIGEALSLDLSIEVASTAESVAMGPGNRVTSRDFLFEGTHEAKGFGLYSYILFGKPPNEATRDRYLAALRSFLDMPNSRELSKSIPRRQLNVTYVPVKGHSAPSSAEALLEVYDYGRASGLLARISCAHGKAFCGALLGGPYIVSTTEQLSGQASISDHFLFQNLSSVPARIVPLWVDEFMQQSSQTEFWKERNGAQVALKLRTAIAILGDSLTPTKAAASDWKRVLAEIVWHK